MRTARSHIRRSRRDSFSPDVAGTMRWPRFDDDGYRRDVSLSPDDAHYEGDFQARSSSVAGNTYRRITPPLEGEGVFAARVSRSGTTNFGRDISPDEDNRSITGTVSRAASFVEDEYPRVNNRNLPFDSLPLNSTEYEKMSNKNTLYNQVLAKV